MNSPFSKEVYERNSKIYRSMANPIRLEILNMLKNQEMNVEEIRKVVGVRIANISQHLTVLKHLKLVKSRREGQKIYYTISHPMIVEPCRILKDLWEKNSFD